MHINGPKGIGSFFPLILNNNKNIDMIAPRMNDRNMFNKVNLIPKINPSTPMSFISPPPIPPFDIMAIIKNIPLEIISANILLIIFGDVSYNINCGSLYMIAEININILSESGMI
ncbi:MAG: hypothetical protein ACFWUA_10015 [Sporanaerobacter sp.]